MAEAGPLLPYLNPENYPGERLSSVAGIIDPYGGIRFVVSEEWRIFEHHVRPRELCFVVPGFLVKEPVPWDYIPTLVKRVELYVKWFRETRNDLELESNPAIVAYQTRINRGHRAGTPHIAKEHNACGECSACCRIPFIRIDADAGGGLCRNYCGGCKIYETRPKPCRDFKCLWLKSQLDAEPMPPELRPDRCGVVFTPDTTTNDPLIFEVHRDPERPGLVDTPLVQDFIGAKQSTGLKARLITSYLPDPSE